MADYTDWSLGDSCAYCPACCACVPCDGYLDSLLDAIDRHRCVCGCFQDGCPNCA